MGLHVTMQDGVKLKLDCKDFIVTEGRWGIEHPPSRDTATTSHNEIPAPKYDCIVLFYMYCIKPFIHARHSCCSYNITGRSDS